jgi:hypothetical protein
MTIKQLELYHGAVLSKITRNKNNKISLIEWDEKEDRAIYKIDTPKPETKKIFVKTGASSRQNKNKSLSWTFGNVPFYENCFYAFVCIEAKIIDKDTIMEICLINPKQVKGELFLENESKNNKIINFTISLEAKKSFRVKRKAGKNIEIIINRNAIETL